jgi:hypothetical protein
VPAWAKDPHIGSKSVFGNDLMPLVIALAERQIGRKSGDAASLDREPPRAQDGRSGASA